MAKGLKVALIGAGGMRTPLMVEAAARRSFISELVLYDPDRRRLDEVLPIAEIALSERPTRLKISAASSEQEALTGIDAAFISIRPGTEQGRVPDESIPLKHGLVGQETVGAGGIFLACRTIPEVVRLAGLVRKLSPKAWILNFTNPVGMTTQALMDARIKRAVGICDSAQSHKYAAAAYLGAELDEVGIKVCGLNHLSFCYSITHRGVEVLDRLLSDAEFLERFYPAYDRGWLARIGMLPNEYPYYYLDPDGAAEKMRSEPLRAERVRAMRKKLAGLVRRWRSGAISDAQLLDGYRRIIKQREESYMSYAHPTKKRERALPSSEGYAGVALDFIAGAFTGKRDIVLSIDGAKKLPEGLGAGDVVEVSCVVSPKRIRRGEFCKLPSLIERWIARQKRCERLVCEAVRKKSRALLWKAFLASPVIGKRRSARGAFEELLVAHGQHFEDWR